MRSVTAITALILILAGCREQGRDRFVEAGRAAGTLFPSQQMQDAYRRDLSTAGIAFQVGEDGTVWVHLKDQTASEQIASRVRETFFPQCHWIVSSQAEAENLAVKLANDGFSARALKAPATDEWLVGLDKSQCEEGKMRLGELIAAGLAEDVTKEARATQGR